MNLRKNTPADGVVVDEPAGGSNKKMLVAGGVAAGLAVVAAMSFVLLSGGSDNAAGGVVAAAKHSAAGQPSAAPTASGNAPAIKKFTGKNARDPFKPLVVEPVSSSGGSTNSASGSGVPVTNPTVAPTGPTTVVVPAPSSTTPATPVPSASTAKSTTVSMAAVAAGDSSARVKVDGKSYEVKPLEEFGTYFKLLALRDSRCGTVQYGDVIFDLCEGESRTFR